MITPYPFFRLIKKEKQHFQLEGKRKEIAHDFHQNRHTILN